MGNPNVFRYLKKGAPALLFALSAAVRRCGPIRCQGQLDAHPEVAFPLSPLAAACRVLYLRMKGVYGI